MQKKVQGVIYNSWCLIALIMFRKILIKLIKIYCVVFIIMYLHSLIFHLTNVWFMSQFKPDRRIIRLSSLTTIKSFSRIQSHGTNWTRLDFGSLCGCLFCFRVFFLTVWGRHHNCNWQPVLDSSEVSRKVLTQQMFLELWKVQTSVFAHYIFHRLSSIPYWDLAKLYFYRYLPWDASNPSNACRKQTVYPLWSVPLARVTWWCWVWWW